MQLLLLLLIGQNRHHNLGGRSFYGSKSKQKPITFVSYLLIIRPSKQPQNAATNRHSTPTGPFLFLSACVHPKKTHHPHLQPKIITHEIDKFRLIHNFSFRIIRVQIINLNPRLHTYEKFFFLFPYKKKKKRKPKLTSQKGGKYRDRR